MGQPFTSRASCTPRTLGALALALFAACSLSLRAQAANIFVTDFVDDTATNGTCTLREAIRSANTNTGIDDCQAGSSSTTDTILVPAGVHLVDLTGGNGDDVGLFGDLDVTDDVVIEGASPGFTIVDGTGGGSPTDRLLHIDSVSQGVTLEGLTLRGGSAVSAPFKGGGVVWIESGSVIMRNVEITDGVASAGGGIYSADVLEIENSRIAGNQAVDSGGTDDAGGGIFQAMTAAELNVRDCEIEGNQADDYGGGIASRGGTLHVLRSRVAGNMGGLAGGGVVAASPDFFLDHVEIVGNQADFGAGVLGSAQGEIQHSAFIGNQAGTAGGGLYDEFGGFVRFSTFSDNTAPQGAGVFADASQTLLDALTIAGNNGSGVHNQMGAFFENTLIAENSGGNCTGAAPAFGAFNLEDTDTCGFVNSAPAPNFPNTAPLLGALGDHGGPTPTIPLLPGSPAIDAVSSEIRMNCQQMLDQRGHPRGRPRTQNAQDDDVFLCDIGAFELTVPFVVDSLADAVDADPMDDVCLTAGATCTLRAAIQQANALPGDYVIELGPGVHTLAIAGTGENFAATGDLDVDPPLHLRGAGAGVSVVDGAGLDRVFDVGAPDHVSTPVDRTRFEDLTITGGDAGSDLGGGIQVRHDPVQLERVVLSANAAQRGGAVWASASTSDLSLVDSTVSGNTGGMALYATDAHIERSTLSGNLNTLTGNGGAAEFGKVHLVNSTVSGNDGDGTGAFFAQQAVVDSSTIYDNDANFAPGGVFVIKLSALRNSIIANNRVTGVPDNCSFGAGDLRSLGFNFSDTPDDDCALDHVFDQTNSDPLLLALADNGGPTLTHLPDQGSDVLDAGDDDSCPATDQRGFGRPGEGDGQGDPHCDIGAVEVPEPGRVPMLAAGVLLLRSLARRRGGSQLARPNQRTAKRPRTPSSTRADGRSRSAGTAASQKRWYSPRPA